VKSRAAKTHIPTGHKVIALIPARGGSRGIEGKNLRLLAGKSLLSYTIQAAMQARYVTDVYVSSDDAAIRESALQAGCSIVVRPPDLATDDALATDVVLHFLESVPFVRESDPIIVYLQPTSPLRTAAHIDKALGDMMQTDAPGIVSVVELMRSPFKSFRIDAEGYLQALFGETETNLNRQALPRTFAANGAIYAFRASRFLENQGFPSNGSLPLVMSESDSIDIDSQDDLLKAEQMIRDRYGA